MYLTRMQLDVKKRETMRALASPGMIHGAVECAFPGERKRRLWRVDCLNGKWFLMLVSEEKPDLSNAMRQFGMSDTEAPWETKDYEPLLKRIQAEDHWHFRLTANPTVSRMPNIKEKEKKESVGGKPRGKVYAHLTVEQQEKWLADRAEAHGFALEEGGFKVVHREWCVFKKKAQKKGQISILAVTFEGVLHVTDAESFCQTLQEGIGRGKAYGMGMLTVAGLQREEKGEKNG